MLSQTPSALSCGQTVDAEQAELGRRLKLETERIQPSGLAQDVQRGQGVIGKYVVIPSITPRG